MPDRIKEPSTWAGIGLLGLAFDKIFDINEAALVGNDILTAAANGGTVSSIVAVAVGSILSVLLPERKD